MSPRSIRRLTLFTAVLLMVATTGCYHFHVQVPEPLPATQWRKEVVAVKYWGAEQERVVTTNCLGNAIDQIVVSTHFGYQLLAVLTLGSYVPLQIEWRCSKDPSQGGTL